MEDDLTLEEHFRETLADISKLLTSLDILGLARLFPKIHPREVHEIKNSPEPAQQLFDNLLRKGSLSSTNVDVLIKKLKCLDCFTSAEVLRLYKVQHRNLIDSVIQRRQQFEQEHLPTPSPTKQPRSQEVDGKMPGIKNKIFISFSFSVEKEVTAIKEKIEREVGEGSCWICTTEILAGDTLSKEITDAINRSDVMVCMINQKYFDSKMCVDEFLLADKLGKEIIPVHLEKVEWPYKKSNGDYSPMQLAATKLTYVPLYKEHKKEEFSKLISRLKKILGEERNASAVEENVTIDSPSTSSVCKRPSQDEVIWKTGRAFQAWDVSTNKWGLPSVHQSHTTIDDFTAESGSDDESSESTDKEVKSGRNQKEEPRPLKKRCVTGDEKKQEHLIKLQRTTKGDILQKYGELQGNITRVLTQSDCEKLGDYLHLPKEQVEAIQNSGSSSKVFVDVLEKSDLIHPADISKLLAALQALNINDAALQMLEDYTKFKDQLSFLPLRDEAVVTTEGRILVIPNTGVRLEIPRNALEKESLIKMRIIARHFPSEAQLLFSRNSAAIVELLPNNLKLLKPVKLTLPHCLVMKEGSQRTAKIYSSHHQQGAQPSWEEVHNPCYELRDHDCDIWLQHFSWKTYVVDDEHILGKELMLYAAKCLPSTSKNALIDVGYYYALPGEKPLTLNKATVWRPMPIVFYKEPKHDLEFSLEELDPPTFTCMKNTKRIPFDLVATVKYSVCTFKVKKNPDAVTEEFTCTFSAAQQPRTYELMFNVVPQSSSGEDDNSNTNSKGLSATALTDQTIQDLSRKLGNSWKEVGRLLMPEIGEDGIDNLESKSAEQGERAFQMLIKWMRMKGNSATGRDLGEALEQAKRRDLLTYLH